MPDTAPGAHTHIRVGDIDVFALLDSRISGPRALFPDAEKPGADTSFGPGPFVIDVNCFAIRTAGKLCLVDAGSGPWRGEPGHVVPAMRKAGLDPAEVDAILMTHMHGDHAGGLTTPEGAAFARAELMLAEDEAEFWSDPGLPSRAPERMQATIGTAQRSFVAYEGRTTPFAWDREIVPGVTGIGLPGHTPGHTGFRIESGGESLFLWADIVHAAVVQFPHPDWTIVFDVDGEQAVATRERIFAQCAAEGTRVAGSHLAFPGTGRVVVDAGTYAWEPETA